MKQGKYCYKCQKRNWKITKQRSAGRGRQAGLGIWILLEMDYDVRVPSLGILQALLSGSLAHSDCWIRDGRGQVLREQEQEQPPGGWGVGGGGQQLRPPRSAPWAPGTEGSEDSCASLGRNPPRGSLGRTQAPQSSPGLQPPHIKGSGLTTQGGRAVLQGLAHGQQDTCRGEDERTGEGLVSSGLSQASRVSPQQG